LIRRSVFGVWFQFQFFAADAKSPDSFPFRNKIRVKGKGRGAELRSPYDTGVGNTCGVLLRQGKLGRSVLRPYT
jgi:hypothetical protein